MKVIVDKAEEVAAWASKRLHTKFVAPYSAIGFETDAGKPVGALIFNDYTGENIEMSVVGLWTKKMFRVAGDYCFNQLGVQRVTARTSVDKTKVINVIIAAGFRVEGRVRRYYPGGGDAVLFGILKEECDWRLPSTQGNEV
jgi:RimJ/RimL family protein N-acetyltransferase